MCASSSRRFPFGRGAAAVGKWSLIVQACSAVGVEHHHFEEEPRGQLTKVALGRALQRRDGLAAGDLTALVNLTKPVLREALAMGPVAGGALAAAKAAAAAAAAAKAIAKAAPKPKAAAKAALKVAAKAAPQAAAKAAPKVAAKVAPKAAAKAAPKAAAKAEAAPKAKAKPKR